LSAGKRDPPGTRELISASGKRDPPGTRELISARPKAAASIAVRDGVTRDGGLAPSMRKMT